MDYVNGKIYKIVNNVNDEVYVGSTTQTLAKRFSVHKDDSKRESKNSALLYQVMNEIGIENFCISLIKEYPCTTKTELCLEEGKYIREIGTLNQRIAGRTNQQYYKDNIEKIQEKHRKYSKENREKGIERSRKYYEDNVEKVKEKGRKYYEANKEKVFIRNNEWRRNNSQKLIIKCACGSKCNRADFYKHTRTKKHITHVNALIIQKYFKSWF